MAAHSFGVSVTACAVWQASKDAHSSPEQIRPFGPRGQSFGSFWQKAPVYGWEQQEKEIDTAASKVTIHSKQ